MMKAILAIFAIAFALSLIGKCTTSMENSAKAARAAEAKAQKQRDEEKQTEACRQQRDTRVAEYQRHFDAKAYDKALTAFGDCPALLRDKELIGMLNDARREILKETIVNKTASLDDRVEAARSLRLHHPEAANSLAKVEASLVKQRDARDKAAAQREAAIKRSKGVNIGMSAEDVRASSWGHPNRVNRTTTKYGTREQWVYDGGYLYFENDVLTAIQN